MDGPTSGSPGAANHAGTVAYCRICSVPEQQGAKGWGLKGALGLVTTERLFQDPGGTPVLHCIWRLSRQVGWRSFL